MSIGTHCGCGPVHQQKVSRPDGFSCKWFHCIQSRSRALGLGPSLGLWFQFSGELESSGGDVMALSETAALAPSCDCFTPGISRSSWGYVPVKGFQTLGTAS